MLLFSQLALFQVVLIIPCINVVIFELFCWVLLDPILEGRGEAGAFPARPAVEAGGEGEGRKRNLSILCPSSVLSNIK